MIDLNARLHIEKLGQRGEGIARGGNGPVYVPHALPGETIVAETDGERGRLAQVLVPSPDRIAPICQYYTICGGCAVQAYASPAYAAWKRGLLADALARAGFAVELAPMIDAHGPGRRRATFHARTFHDARGYLKVETGFMQARAHAIVEIEACPVLAPAMDGALPLARALAKVLAPLEKPLDITVTATLSGLDVDVRGTGALDFPMTQKLIGLAQTHDLARVSNHGAILVERRPPMLAMGRAMLVLPPGGFLQATQAGEDMLAQLVLAAAHGVKRVADLFAGVGTFALRLAEKAEVLAVENDPKAIAACEKAAHGAQGLRRLTIETRDLFVRPLTTAELDGFGAVVFDPPRAGAQAQCAQLAASKVPRIIAVSCNIQNFCRDAKILTDGGYRLDSVTPIDQFRYSPHVEMVGVFSRPAAKGRKRGVLS